MMCPFCGDNRAEIKQTKKENLKFFTCCKCTCKIFFNEKLENKFIDFFLRIATIDILPKNMEEMNKVNENGDIEPITDKKMEELFEISDPGKIQTIVICPICNNEMRITKCKKGTNAFICCGECLFTSFIKPGYIYKFNF